MYVGVDLGSTNIKVAIYDGDMKLVDRQSVPVKYYTEGGVVEFDAEKYCELLVELLGDTARKNNVKEIKEIAFTGQAESLICLDKSGKPLMNAISWMDERSVAECETLSNKFPHEVCEEKTGQMAVLPTWPATKILWLKNNRNEIYSAVVTYMMLKDYVVYYLTGKKTADMSIATFSFYFDIYNKCYWKEMLEAIGVDESQLPPLVEPCSTIGELKPEICESIGVKSGTRINNGTLDHFTGMIGTGNTEPGSITLSTGTVMALATLCGETVPKNTGIAVHYGFKKNSYILLPVAESGGVSLEWFRRSCIKGADFKSIDENAALRQGNEVIFLPYIVGTNAPEFDTEATGVFWGIRQENDEYDMALAIMEGVSFVLRKNCEQMSDNGVKVESIIATGGGAKSSLWCQLQADITGLPVRIPAESEAACLGAAIIAAVASGKYASYEEAGKDCLSFVKEYTPCKKDYQEKKYKRFCALYDAALKINDIK
ncbi:MAG: hypothetical protein IJJ40_02160 [Clostridia bacterium]|nr:hypothetical protein [Clostridia bacterium]